MKKYQNMRHYPWYQVAMERMSASYGESVLTSGSYMEKMSWHQVAMEKVSWCQVANEKVSWRKVAMGNSNNKCSQQSKVSWHQEAMEKVPWRQVAMERVSWQKVAMDNSCSQYNKYKYHKNWKSTCNRFTCGSRTDRQEVMLMNPSCKLHSWA